MPADRLRSIVPMFGGATRYVETLEMVLEFVDGHHPTTHELVGWHRGKFANVSSRQSILRRVSYLEDVGFLEQENETWQLGTAGREYVDQPTTETLLRVMCERNVGLRSLMYALSAGAMDIEEISDQQLDTHPELGWSRGETDMAKQRTNWLRSMGLVEKSDGEYRLTQDGHQFVADAVDDWADSEWSSASSDAGEWATTYETTAQARAVDPEFRETVLARYESTCPVSGVDYRGLLDVAHVLPWNEYPDHRADLENVLALSKTHHAAFDRELFTIDRDRVLRVNPAFETESDLLQRTILDRAGEQVLAADGGIDTAYLDRRNRKLDWF